MLWRILGGRLRPWAFNVFPAYRGTGGRVTYVSPDFREIRVKIPLNWRTRNYVGTIFGGSLYAAVDPFFMIMLIQILGPDYVVWDRAAAIRFLKPGRTTLFAKFEILEAETDAIRALLRDARSIDRTYTVELADAAGVVHAAVEKILYIRKKESGTP